MPKTTKRKNNDAASSGAAGFLASKPKKYSYKNKGGTSNVSWWLEPKDKVHNAIVNDVSLIENAQSLRRRTGIMFAQLYGNYEVYNQNTTSRGPSQSNNNIKMNIIQSVIDAAAAKIAKNQPKVSFVTNGADDYFLKIRAHYLTKYISGLMKESGFYDSCELVFRDAEVFGTGFIKVLEDDGQIKTEWVYWDEIRVDQLDGMKQKPRSLHQVRLVAKDQLKLQFPEFADQIESSLSVTTSVSTVQTTTDLVKVMESWHLRSSKTSKDGRHVISIETTSLLDEEWDKDYFPIVAFRWYSKPLGYFGRSITEEIMSIQIEINKILLTIQQAQELAAVPIVFVENASEVSEDVLLSNVIMRMVPYSGTPPAIVSPTALSGEVYSHLNSMIQWAFQVVGLSQASASGLKQPGVESAVAIREVVDIETGRFAMVAKRWEDFFVEVARIMVDMSKDLYTKNPELKTFVNENKTLKEIPWKKVDLEENPFDIQCFPTSQLPDTPAGRVQTITEYIQNQWISKERGMELLNIDPDLENEVNIQTSSLQLTEAWLTEMVEDGEAHLPDPLMNLALAQQVAQGVYSMLVKDKCPEDRLKLVRAFIMECIRLQEPPPEAAPPPGMEQLPPEGLPPEGLPPEGMPIPGSQPPPGPMAELAPLPPPLS